MTVTERWFNCFGKITFAVHHVVCQCSQNCSKLFVWRVIQKFSTEISRFMLIFCAFLLYFFFSFDNNSIDNSLQIDRSSFSTIFYGIFVRLENNQFISIKINKPQFFSKTKWNVQSTSWKTVSWCKNSVLKFMDYCY